MPINEKTVELNVTRTIVEKVRRLRRRPAYAIGLDQAQEARLGFDVAITDGSWCGGLIQYKRLYRRPHGLTWRLNRTVARDQHSLLLHLERRGFPVFYAFPQFDDESDLRAWTPPALWSRVWWIVPSSLRVPTPVNTHHTVTYSGGAWAVHSEHPTPIDPTVLSFPEVEARLVSFNPKRSLKHLKLSFNEAVKERWAKIALRQPDSATINRRRADNYVSNIARGLMLFGIYGEG